MSIHKLLGGLTSGWDKAVSKTSGMGRSLADVFAGTDASVHKATNMSNYQKLLGGGTDKIDDASMKHLDYWSDQTGGELTQEGLRAIQRDAAAGLTPGQGASAAGTVKGNMLTNAFNPVDKGMMGGLGAMTAGGLVGGGAAYATDGATEQGALLGAIAGVGIRNIGQGLAKGLVGDMPGIEKKFVDDLLGPPSKSSNQTVADMAGPMNKEWFEQFGDVKIGPGNTGKTHAENFENVLRKREGFDAMPKDASATSWYLDMVDPGGGKSGFMSPKIFNPKEGDRAVTEALRGGNARKARLDEVANMDKSNLGFWDKQKHATLTGKKDLGVAQKTRMAGAIGSALTGMAFSSSRRDHRRGFNKRRGNRV
jgi:hypothetical protein